MRRVWTVVIALWAQLSFGAVAFGPALPGYEFHFPRDHGDHDTYRTEWWYTTGNVRAASGRRYGFELTFFRVGIDPSQGPERSRWELRHLAIAHFAVTDVEGKAFRYYEKLNRLSPFTARAAVGYLDVANEGWSATTMQDGSWHLVAFGGSDAIDLTLRARKPPAIHGTDGVSVKAEGVGYASHYYSMTRIEASGSLVSGGKRERVSGEVWMDHEFGSSALREHQVGWDWFAVQLDNDTELMLYQIRRRDGTPDVTSSGSLITSDGSVIHIRREQMRVRPTGTWRSPHSGATYPMGWRIDIASLGVAVVVTPLLRDQELATTASTRVTYWEGAVGVSGSFGGTPVQGQGYVEMTGYAGRVAGP
jgi:predicted secreted hydrolase